MKLNYIKPKSIIHIVDSTEIICGSQKNIPYEETNDYKETKNAMDNIESFLNAYIENQKKELPESVSLSEFYTIYGIDLKNSPDDTWEFIRVDTGIHGNKIERFEKNIAQIGDYHFSRPFTRCEAIVIDDNATNFIFKDIPYSEDQALNIIFPFVRNFMRNGNYTHEECRNEYLSKTQQSNMYLTLSSLDNSLNFALSADGTNMNASIHTSLVSPSKPKVIDNFVPDMTSVFIQSKELLANSIVMCQLYNQIAGTKESVQNSNTVTFVPTELDRLSEKDIQISAQLEKWDELIIEKDKSGYVLYTPDKSARIGNVPSGLDIAIGAFYDNNWIKGVQIYERNIGYHTIEIKIGM